MSACGPLERELDRFDAINFLNSDPHAMRTDGAVHPEDLQLDARVFGARLSRHDSRSRSIDSLL